MYICICHGFNEKKVASALSAGAHTTAGVYRHLGHVPQCGKCVPEVRNRVKEHCRQHCAGGCADMGSDRGSSEGDSAENVVYKTS